MRSSILEADKLNKPEKKDYVHRPFLKMPGPPKALKSKAFVRVGAFCEESDWQKRTAQMQ